ncbi:helix-turn-helix domain-containing protein [Bifidobacterium sp.]|jgi:transcriptional regulator with XRE-family HTH domain|uniref:helix-turn-helix domain-containing protein n=1 Tax=Bifidobacterium sp. TaxID=41200 RepID=UPI0025C0CEF7|nr:helix-turn-helix transcriptional regulator [Bifidobacterium sp.]MCH4210059.1 helix-turn-helix domain-containing protein [Bifidobacterium sp.]
MTKTMEQESSTLSARVAKYRRDAGFASAEKLADKIMEDGAPDTFKRSTVRSIENGRKPDVTVTELLLLAKALNISPIMLIVDFDDLPASPEYPGLGIRNNYEFAQWMMMRAYYPGRQPISEDSGHKINYAKKLITYIENYRSFIGAVRFEEGRLATLGEEGMEEFIKAKEKYASYAETIRTLVKRDYGIDLAELDKQIGD